MAAGLQLSGRDERVDRGAARRPAMPARTRRALATAPPTGILVAEGDSWFDYPLNDVLSMLSSSR